MKKEAKRGWRQGEQQWPKMEEFRERRTSFSLEIRVIQPSADFGVRRENDLRGTGYAWTPVLVSFFKLLEVGFLPTWVLFPFLVFFECLSRLRPLGAVGSVPKHGTELIQFF